MSILSVDNIQPIGSGTSVTVNSAATLVLNNVDSVGVATASNFKTGSSNLHSTGLTVGNNFLHSTGINVGTGATIHVPATNVLTLGTNSNERLRILSDGKVGIGSDIPDATLDLQSNDTEILLRLNTKPIKNGYLDIVSDANRRGVIRFKDSLPDGGNYRWSVGNGDSDELANTSFHISLGNSGGNAAKFVIDSTGSVFAGGTVLSVSDLNWTKDTYQRPHIFSGITGGNPSDGAIVVASPETNPSNTRIGALVFGCKTSSTTGVSNSGLKAVIEGYTNTNVSDAWKTGGYLKFMTRENNGGLSERLRISSAGYVTKPNHPSFLAGRTGGNQTFTVGVYPLNVARINVGNHYNTSTYKFVAPVAGIYYFYGQVYYNNGSGSYRVGIRKTPNGGTAFMLNTAGHEVVGNDDQQSTGIIESMAVGDAVDLFCDSNVSMQCYYNINDTTYGAHTYFMGYLIG